MAGIFPNSQDGGLPPSPGSTYPSHAYPPTTNPLDTAALYFGNDCNVRLRPELFNSVISEIESTCDSVGWAYQAGLLTNLQTAVGYMIQRGLPCYAALVGGPNVYTSAMLPKCVKYQDGMALIVVPNVTNQGAVSVNMDGTGLVPVLRNDGQQLQSGDWIGGVPQPIAYRGGNFYQLGLCASQVPLLPVQSLDVWVRTDGSDVTGDGSANTAAKAFNTIQHAWDVVSGRYAATPTFVINIRLGIPGTYAAANKISTYGGTVKVWGDPNNAAAYKISGAALPGNIGGCLSFGAVSTFWVIGLTFLCDQAYPLFHTPLAAGNASTGFAQNCNFTVTVANNNATLINVRTASHLYLQGTINVDGGNLTIGNLFAATDGSSTGNSGNSSVALTYNVNNITFGSAIFASTNANIAFSASAFNNSNTHGPRYAITQNAILIAGGNTLPGDLAGNATYGAQYVP